ncbi:MAG TPA: hypothetical protein VEG33_19085 [Streptosporangiaceae bacterium]|nr:hypothetical protein [Streptosporangiaceae bacterium]
MSTARRSGRGWARRSGQARRSRASAGGARPGPARRAGAPADDLVPARLLRLSAVM